MKGTVSPRVWVIAGIIFILIGMAARLAGIWFISLDMRYFMMPWYVQLLSQGFPALATNFSNYTPAYLYLLWFATWTSTFIPEIAAIKLIPILFDIGNAIWVYKILRLKYREAAVPFLGAALFFALPTVILDSAWWGQVDALYIFFVLGCLYFLLRERPVAAMLFFGIAFAFKLQSIFLAPFLFLLLLKRRIPWWTFLLVPLVYVVTILPAVYAGRPLWDALTIYFGQSDDFRVLSLNAPNLYLFFPEGWYTLVLIPSLAVTALFALLWSVGYARKIKSFTPEIIVMCAAASAAALPFLLPKMHERYFYIADVLLLLTAFYLPRLWFTPALAQIVSGLTYSAYLFFPPLAFHPRLITDSALVVPAALVNTLLIVILIWKQYQLVNSRENPSSIH